MDWLPERLAQMREAAIPPWERDALPLVFAGEALAVVPGVGIDPAFRAGVPGSGVTLMWQPTGSPQGDEAAPIG